MNDFLHSYPGQEVDEPVYIFARPYWVSFLPTALIFVFLIAVSLLTMVGLLSNIFPFLPAAQVQTSVYVLGIFQLLVLLVFFVAVLDFYYDIVVVTDRKVVDIDQEQLFFRRISQLNLEDVEDTTSVIKGFFPSVFNYGSVEVQTAGEARNFEIPNILHPHRVEAIIADLASHAKDRVPEGSRLPHGEIKGVINAQEYGSAEELREIGAMDPNDPRLSL